MCVFIVSPQVCSHISMAQHFKGSLLGASDSNGDEDTKMTVSFVGNYWKNIGSRTPSIRFGHGTLLSQLSGQPFKALFQCTSGITTSECDVH